MQPFFGKGKVKELFLENLTIFSKKYGKSAQKYSKIGELIFQNIPKSR